MHDLKRWLLSTFRAVDPHATISVLSIGRGTALRWEGTQVDRCQLTTAYKEALRSNMHELLYCWDIAGSVIAGATGVASGALNLTQHDQFWWNWWVQLATAVATFLAVIVALFGSRLQNVFFRPELNVWLLDAHGEATTTFLTDPETGSTRSESARYYHLRVSTKKTWPAATGVQVVLMGLETADANGDFRPVWSSEVPVRWRHQELYPLARTIGPQHADCDLVSAVKGKWVELHPLVVPTNLQARHRTATTFMASFQARGNESMSPIVRVKVAWDGQWSDGAVEMGRHLSVKLI